MKSTQIIRSARVVSPEGARRLTRGESYWHVVTKTGRTYCELDTINDQTRGRRHLDWYLDIVATNDVAHLDELWLHTPAGDVALRITDPHTAYIFNSSLMSNEGRFPVAQVIGRVDDKAAGTGIAFIWDVGTQQVYQDTNACVLNFAAWRPGICHVGELNLGAMGVRL